MDELQLDDIDDDWLLAWRKGVLSNPVVATVIESKDGNVTKSRIRLRQLDKVTRRKVKRMMNQR